MTASLQSLLKQTSRSFYLTLRVLPVRVRHQIGLAYLLARTTDTVADTEIVGVEQRLQALDQLRSRILGSTTMPLDFGELVSKQGLPAERQLLERVEESLELLRSLSPDDLVLVRAVLDTITSGQQLDLQRFEAARTERLFVTRTKSIAVIALQSEAALDDYTYRVAGCVGEFWTKLCRAHLFPKAILDDTRLLADGIRFGKGLQLVNILRDVPADLHKGRCYLPSNQLGERGLSPEDLLTPTNEARLRPVYNQWLALADEHLKAGWRYTNTLPREQVRVRLACAWPILIGFKTVERLRTGNVLDAQKRIKISRAEVRSILFSTVLKYPFRRAWQRLASLSEHPPD